MTRRAALSARLRAEGLPLLPAAIAIGVVVAWAATGGGYESQPALGVEYNPDRWYLGALALVGLLLATTFGLGRAPLSRAAKVACAAFAAYVAWSFLSLFWAADQGSAFLGSGRALVYFAVFATFAILSWSDWSMRVALGMLVAGLGALAIVAALRIALLANPASLYINARLSYPLGYYNADAAMFMMTAVTAIALCSRRDVPAPLRVAGIVTAAVCLQLAILGQSRGWLFTAPVVLILALALVPGRLRLLAFALGPALAAGATAPALLHVYGSATVGGVALREPRLGAVLHSQSQHAARAMLIADVALAALATLAVIADRRITMSAAALRRVNRLGAALAATAVLAGLAGGLLATHGHPLARAEKAWNSFANYNNTASGSSRFTTLGSERVDFWRVALRDFARHPLLGIGQDNFAASYLRERRTGQEPRWTHSLELRLLTHTGLVGTLLFAVFVVAVLAGALRVGPGRAGARVAVGIALLPAMVWLVHGSIDWFWEFPALSVPALAFAGAALALAGRPSHAQESARARRAPSATKRRAPALTAAAWICAGLLAAGALAALAVPFVAARRVASAIASWPRRPAHAYAELRSAANLTPFNAQIYLLGGAIGVNLGEPARAARWFAEAQQQDDQAWLAPFALGLIDGERGRRAAARAQLQRARALNPSEGTIALALTRLARGRPLTFAEAQGILATRAELRFRR
jgi:hypothetical protein